MSNQVTSAPLSTRILTQNIAYIKQPLASLDNLSGFISTQQFIKHVVALAEQLPGARHCINLCSNRYLFMVAFCAAIIKQQTNLLPSNKNIATQQRLAERYPDTYVLHNGDCEIAAELTEFSIAEYGNLTSILTNSVEVPQVPLDAIAAISFTSGSTGDAKPNIKTWRTLVESTTINRHYMIPPADNTQYLVATVPAQHMWGLETSVLMALFADVCVVDSKPLFPQDIGDLLNALPEPRLLVSTPVHLRSLVASDLHYPKLNEVLCATSPLTSELATQVEQRFNTSLREVYGCSEIGSMAIRNTANNEIWQRFNGIEFSRQQDQTILASAAHVINDAVLGDFIETVDETHFKLSGRSDDMIDIAGKRGSLNEINKVLLKFTELVDGVVFFPVQNRAIPRLVALVVLPDEISKQQVAEHFRQYVDPAFIPRPIIVVNKLPREENGKLPKQKLLSFYEEIRK